jgi:tRNA nucleotidyltransferase/poly(A) polymerase
MRELAATIPVSQEVRIIADALRHNDSDAQVYIVGGAVRDFLYHQFHDTVFKIKDEDLATNLSEEEILHKLRDPYAVSQGIRVKEKESIDTFGVVFASVKGVTVEVAPFRKDIGSADGRHPDRVERGTIYDDAMRRDLTINNLYYDFEKGLILDFNPEGQGIEDIRRGIARPVGDPFERFEEDKIRILRLLRFFCRFNPGSITASLDRRTSDAVTHFKKLNQYSGITPERIKMEFVAGIKQSLDTVSYLINLGELDLYQAVFPGLKVDLYNVEKLRETKNLRVILAWLLKDNPYVGDALNRLKYSNDTSEPVDFLARTMRFAPEDAVHMIKQRDNRLIRTGKKKLELTAKEAARNKQITQEGREDLLELAQVMGRKNTPDLHQIYRMEHLAYYLPPEISGAELMAQGYQGSDIGERQREIILLDYNEHYLYYVMARDKDGFLA